MDLDMILRYSPLLLHGLWTTIYITAVASGFAIGLGLAVSLLNAIPFGPMRWLCRMYIEAMRGTPVLILLFILYYGGPFMGFAFEAIPTGIICLSFYGAGYFAEIFRAGFESIPAGQIEAARMLCIPKSKIITRIKIPQMLTLIIPPSTNQVILLLKESALLSIITVAELTKNTTQMVNETFAVVEPYVMVALLYWAVIESVSFFGRYLERKVKHA